MDKDQIDQALAGVFGQPKPRLKLSGEPIWDEHTGKLIGAEVDFVLDEQKPEPPLRPAEPE